MTQGGADQPVARARIARQAAFRIGVTAETRAAAYLVGRGYAIAARRFKSKVGEVDIVARRDAELIFVEVKAIDLVTVKAELVASNAHVGSSVPCYCAYW